MVVFLLLLLLLLLSLYAMIDQAMELWPSFCGMERYDVVGGAYRA